MNKYEYKTESGLVLRLKTVSNRVIQGVLLRVKKDFKERGEPITPPFYVVETLGGEGETEKVPLTADTLEDPEDPKQTQRNRALWEQYEDALERLQQEQNEMAASAWPGLGVSVKLPEGEEWEQFETEMEWVGEAVPENPIDRKSFWLMYSGVLSELDKTTLLTQLQMLSAGEAITPEQIDFFRRKSVSEVSRRFGDLLDSAFLPDGQMASESEIPGIAGDEDVEIDAEPVGEDIEG